MEIWTEIGDFIEGAFSLLESHWDTMTVSTAVLAILTVALTYYTRVLAIEARNTREQSAEPNIVVTIEPSNLAEFYAFLIIENVGNGVGYNVSIRETGNHTFKDDRQEFILNDLAFMNLKILKVGQRIEHLLGQFNDLPNKVFQFDVSAKDVNGRVVKCSNTVDVNCYYDRRGFKTKDMDSLVREIEKIEKNIGHMVSGFKRIRVDTYTQKNRDKEQADRKEMYEEMKKKSDSKNEDPS